MIESAVCTIITKSYLPYARTLASSLAKHNPNIDLYVLLADKVDGYFDPSLEKFKFIYIEDLLHIEEIEQMCFYYTAFELCCALRGVLHEYMFKQTDVQKWVFLDSDIMVYGSLNIIFKQLENSSILLTPHTTSPLSSDYVDPCEINFLRSGLYNAGFLGLRRTHNSEKFISWFKCRLKDFSFDDNSKGLFVDQLWLNLVPLYFDEVEFCLEPGANLGHWNLFDRSLNKDRLGDITVNKKSILFIHFSGWDINNIHKVSKYSPMYTDNAPTPWLELSKSYKDNLFANGYESCLNFPYAFNYFHDGKFIHSEMRRKYYNSLTIEKDILPCSPFSTENYYQLEFENSSSVNKVNILDGIINVIKRVTKNNFRKYFF